jgi:hypothetical protein
MYGEEPARSGWQERTSALARLRWRRRGAWLWPAFAASIVADALIGHALPPVGETESVVAAALLGLFLNLLGVLLLSRPLAALIRRRRGDLPTIVARDYAGTTVVVAITAALLAIGLVHRPQIAAEQHAMNDALARAEAWIGAHAPDQFRRNVQRVSALAIEPGSVYRACVPSSVASRSYCVIVKTKLPLTRSVVFDGYEPNSFFSQGVG